MLSFHAESWMRDEISRRKSLWTELFKGMQLERVPLDIRVAGNPGTTVREQMQNCDLQLDAALETVRESWKLGESSDWIPAMRPDVGCSCLATAYGAEYYWGDNPNQTPGILHPIITDLDNGLSVLDDPDPLTTGWIPEGLRRIRRFVDAGEGDVPVSLLDAAGGVNVAADLLGVTELLTAFYTAPDALHELLASIQRLFIATIDAGIEAAGGVESITTTDFPDFWFPEGCKGHVSDDISANFGPDIYREFSAPYHALVFDRFGSGGLHNCGPNPCHEAYVDGQYAPISIDLSDAYSHDDLGEFRKSLSGRGFIYLTFDRLLVPDREPVSWYREIMELCAPDLVVVPVIYAESAAAGKALYDALNPIATEYARRMRWGWWRRV
jgi:hypothetical protein